MKADFIERLAKFKKLGSYIRNRIDGIESNVNQLQNIVERDEYNDILDILRKLDEAYYLFYKIGELIEKDENPLQRAINQRNSESSLENITESRNSRNDLNIKEKSGENINQSSSRHSIENVHLNTGAIGNVNECNSKNSKISLNINGNSLEDTKKCNSENSVENINKCDSENSVENINLGKPTSKLSKKVKKQLKKRQNVSNNVLKATNSVNIIKKQSTDNLDMAQTVIKSQAVDSLQLAKNKKIKEEPQKDSCDKNESQKNWFEFSDTDDCSNKTDSNNCGNDVQSNLLLSKNEIKNTYDDIKMNNANDKKITISAFSKKFPEQASLEMQKVHKCIITHLINPFNFFVLMDKDYDSFGSLTIQLNEYYKSAISPFRSKKELENSNILYFVCYSEDTANWCRVQISNYLYHHADLVEIYDVDFGSSFNIEYYALIPLEDIFFDTPPLVYKCSLNFIQPALNMQGKWNEEAINICKQYRLIPCITNISKHDQFGYGLDCVIDQKEGKDITWELLVKKLAVLNDAVKLIPENKLSLNNNWNDDKIDNINKVLEKISNVNSTFNNINESDNSKEEMLPVNYKISFGGENYNDEKLLCKHFDAATGKCFKVSCNRIHSNPNPDGWTIQKCRIFNLPPISFPTIESIIIVNVTTLLTFCSFYANIQLKDGPNSILDSLRSVLNNQEIIANAKPFDNYPAMGENILVKNHDGEWCRGIVTMICGDNIDVFFTDFGNVFTVPMTDIREMIHEASIFPQQAQHCTIVNLKLFEDSSSNEIKNELHNLIINKKIIGKVCYISSDGILGLFLYDEHGNNIGEVISNKFTNKAAR